MIPFMQIIREQPNGRIAYYRLTTAGPQMGIGRRLTAHFAAERVERGWWHVTHLPSGRCIPGAASKSFADAQVLAQQLETLTNWSRVSKGSKALAAKVSKVTGASMKAVG